MCKPFKLWTIILAAAFLFSSCGAADDPAATITRTVETETPSPSPSPSAAISTAAEQSEDSTEPAARRGGELRLSMRAPKTLNPLLNEDASVDRILRLIFEPLAVLDETQRPVPNDAFVDSFVFSPDGSSVVVTLKPGARWSDGTPVTASDVTFSLNMLKEAPETALYKGCADAASAAVFLGEYSLRIDFVEPTWSGYALLFPVVPAHYYAGASLSDPGVGVNMLPLGCGSFIFSSYTPAEALILTASDNAASGRPYIDSVTVLVTSSHESDLQSLSVGILDAVYAEFSEWGKFGGSVDARIAYYEDSYFDFIGFNHNRPVFQDAGLRRLIARCLPVDEIMETVYINHAAAALTPVHPSSWLYEPTPASYAYDTEYAARTLHNLGWLAGNDGVLRRSGAEGQTEALAFTLLVNSENLMRVKIAGMLAEGMNAAGLAVTVEEAPFDEYAERLRDGDYDMFVGGFGLSQDGNLSFMLDSSLIGDSNLLNYSDENMDSLLAAMRAAATDSAYRSASAAIQEYIALELPLIGVAFRESALITGRGVYGDINPELDNIYNNIDQWFITR